MPLLLFAIPDEKAEKNHYEIGIPKLGSYILTHEFGGVVPGLKDVPPDQRPPVWPVFFSFRIMVAIGFAMLGLGLWSLWLRWKGGLSRRLYKNRWFLRAAMVMTPSGFGAVLFGWYTAEIGRQPYVVYGLLRTADAVSPVSRGAVRPRWRPSSWSTPLSSASAATTSPSSCGRGPSRSKRLRAAPISAAEPARRRSGRSPCRPNASKAGPGAAPRPRR